MQFSLHIVTNNKHIAINIDNYSHYQLNFKLKKTSNKLEAIFKYEVLFKISALCLTVVSLVNHTR